MYLKRITLFLLILASSILSFSQSQDEFFFRQANAFFKKQVVDGKVNYSNIVEQPNMFNALLRTVADYSFSDHTPEEQKAFLINAYNLLVIKGLVDNYPLSSPQDVSLFFDKKIYTVAGRTESLNSLEKEWLFKAFPDSRLHFVLVCGALGCPPITSFAYMPESLDAELASQTRLALNDPNFIRVNDSEQTVMLSQIFDWYKKEFQASGSALDYINSFRETAIPDSYKSSFYTYDWSINDQGSPSSTSSTDPTSNIQKFTPSVLLGQGQVEVKLFNNLYTQTGFRNSDGEFVSSNRRETFYTGIFQFTTGLDKSARWNIGFEANLQSVRYDSEIDSSPLRIFGNSQESLVFNRTELATLGPRIRFRPFKSIPKLSLTSTLLIPLHDDLETPEFLAHNRTSWITQLFYDKFFGDFQLFAEADLIYRFKTDNPSFTQDAFFRTPLTAFLSYFPNSNTTVSVNLQYSPAFTGLPGNEAGDSFNLNRYFVQGGVGAKYQITKELNLELLYTNFFASRGEGAGQTFNFGIVFLR
ncbi:MAG: DUF547 domain-containing protein [Bacteroidota bacterium]